MGLQSDRVRRHTARTVLRRIDDATVDELARLAGGNAGEIESRVQGLDREWDTDRAIEAEAAITGLAGLALAALVDRRFLVIPGIVGGAVLLHALTGWYPLLPVLRRLGVRSAREIERERYALKALRGDFSDMDHHGGQTSTIDSARDLPAGAHA